MRWLAFPFLLALLAPAAAADHHYFEHLNGAWESFAGFAQQLPNDAAGHALWAEGIAADYTFWAVGQGAYGAGNVQRQVWEQLPPL